MLQNGMRLNFVTIRCIHILMGILETNTNPVGYGLEYLSEVAIWSDDLRCHGGVDVESEWDVMEIFAR